MNTIKEGEIPTESTCHQLIAERIPIVMRKKTSTKYNVEDIKENLFVEVETYIHGLRDKNVIFDLLVPKTWWQMFKGQYFPKWLLTKFPVQNTVIHREFAQYKAVCPHLYTDNYDKHLHWMAYSHDPHDHLR
jgi:hypothetical protein